VIRTREQLIHILTEAAEIEHNLLCSYLYAVFSLKRAGEPEVTEAQGAVLERWRRGILGVALEEMAHLACVNNLLIAVGGAPHFDRPNLPVAPGYHPAELVVRLTPFDRATLDHFIFLERSDGVVCEDGAGFVANGSERRTVVQHGLTPSAQDYRTVGALYDAIAEGFRELAERLGEAALIDPEGRSQVDSELVGLPDISKVTDLETALTVISHIKEEGEGSTGEHVHSHFTRFCAIRAEWDKIELEYPSFSPAWPVAHDPVMRRPADEGARVWVTEQKAAAHLDLANALYGTMLSLLAQSFGGSKREEQRVLMKASVELMEASAAVSVALARMAANPAYPGVNAGMTFAVPRNVAYRPLATKARMLFLERLLELRASAELMLEGQTAEKALRRINAAADMIKKAGTE